MMTIEEVRERLRQSINECIRLESVLHAIEDTNFRVCIFGSARLRPNDPIYRTVFRLARGLGKRGIDVVTGGGPGLMEAANRGVHAARASHSKSYGLPIDLPTIVEPPNHHLDIKNSHKRFSHRLDEFMRLSHAVVVAPGGIGTMLELLYVWQLLQLQVVEGRPVILLGRSFWQGLLAWAREQQLAWGLVDARDLEIIHLADTPSEALEIIDAAYIRFFARRNAWSSKNGRRPAAHPAKPEA
ncbi:MAG: LOG family protein [Armatimonadetes bacterium]|nr:LOG family protein [Armatimonadota bacterium]